MNKKDISCKTALIAAAVLIAIRLILASSQMVFILPFSAPIDDDLYFRMANSIARGEWLGRYDYLTLSKYPLFAVYLAALHILGIPYITGNCIMWITACIICVWAFTPVVKTNFMRLVFFAFMVYNPYSFNETNLRVYRDSLFFVMCTLFFAGMAGWALRLKKDIKNNVAFLVIAGIGMAGSWTGREDGYWLVPFYIVGLIICFIYILKDNSLKNKLARYVSTLIPPVMTVAAVITICSINYKHYQVFTLSDFNGGSFAQCFGAMTRLPHRNWNPLVSVPRDVRQLIYDNCPSLREFEYYLEDETSVIRKSYMHKNTGDYRSGSLYWAIRRRANEMNIYESRTKAERFWAKAAEEVEALCEKTQGSLRPRSSLTPPIKAEYIPDVIREGLQTVMNIITWKDIMPYQNSLSDATTGQIEKWEDFLKEKSNYSAVENSHLPYHTPFQSFCYKVMTAIVHSYRLLTILLLILSAAGLIKGFATFKKQSYEKQILLFVLLGLTGMFIFRRFMIAYMEVASFNIGFYAMYVAAAYPLLTIVSGTAPGFLKD